jgi:hypothetical protein
MNDPSFVEPARALAAHAIREGGQRDHERLTWIWRRGLLREPADSELRLLSTLLMKHRRDYAADRAAAVALGSVGQTLADRSIEPAELAAWTSVARTILNLDEAITRD